MKCQNLMILLVIRLTCSLILSFGLVFIVDAQIDLAPVSTNAFNLEFDTKETNLKTGNIEHGNYSFAESNGKTFVRLKTGDSLYWFLYDGRYCYCALDGNLVICDGKFNISLIPSPIYLPFNTNTWKIFFSRQQFLDFVDMARKAPNTSVEKESVLKSWSQSTTSNMSILNSSDIGDGMYLPARIAELSGGELLLEVGPENRIGRTFRYSSFKNVGKIKVPTKISLTEFGVASQEDRSLIPVKRIECMLKVASLDNVQVPDIDSLMRAGMRINYQEGGVGLAGVLYDPKDGKFENQLNSQLEARKYPIDSKNEEEKTQSETPIIPIFLAVFFAIIAVLLLIKQGRSQK